MSTEDDECKRARKRITVVGARKQGRVMDEALPMGASERVARLGSYMLRSLRPGPHSAVPLVPAASLLGKNVLRWTSITGAGPVNAA